MSIAVAFTHVMLKARDDCRGNDFKLATFNFLLINMSCQVEKYHDPYDMKVPAEISKWMK